MKTLLTGDRMGGVLFDIQQERKRQEELLTQGKFPWSCDNPNIPDEHKLAVLSEEFGEAAREVNEQIQARSYGIIPNEMKRRKTLLREELIQVAAVCVAWCESLDAQEERDEQEEMRDRGEEWPA